MGHLELRANSQYDQHETRLAKCTENQRWQHFTLVLPKPSFVFVGHYLECNVKKMGNRLHIQLVSVATAFV
jgi:hypothetical protein